MILFNNFLFYAAVAVDQKNKYQVDQPANVRVSRFGYVAFKFPKSIAF